ncbi:MAG: putative porin [Alcanivorax sp.]|nr:putative porin [Alcanivorax sp.]
MKKTYLALAVAAALSATHGVAQAQDYNVEFGVFYIDVDVEGGLDDSALGLDATFHFDTVNTAGRPLAEAAFLGRNNNVFVSYLTYDDEDLDVFAFGGEFWLGDIYLAAAYESESSDTFITEDSYAVSLGYMLGDGLLVGVGYEDGDEREHETVSVGAKYVGQVGENFINLEGDLAFTDGDAVLSLDADYFFTHEFGAGLRVIESDESGVKTAYGVGARYFFTPTISAEAEYLTQDDDKIFGFRVAGRF